MLSQRVNEIIAQCDAFHSYDKILMKESNKLFGLEFPSYANLRLEAAHSGEFLVGKEKFKKYANNNIGISGSFFNDSYTSTVFGSTWSLDLTREKLFAFEHVLELKFQSIEATGLTMTV